MMKHGFFSFHIVDESPWPIYMSLGLFSMMMLFLEYCLCRDYFINLKILGSICFVMLSFSGWIRDIISESLFKGHHTLVVQKGLKMGFSMFIISEVMFFISIFWGLYYFSISASINIGSWPPMGVISLDPLGMPLLGSIILMSSGISITWSHYSLLKGEKLGTVISLLMTITLGLLFSFIQLKEYMENSFTMSDSVYGSVFYLSTGFHGIHVIVGSLFLLICLFRIMKNQISSTHHAGYEFAIWYWHFVDVVWLLLYISMYWWGA